MPLIERRYAEALVGISEQTGAIEEYQQEFQSIVGLYNEQQEFKFFLLNPKVKAEEKKDAIGKIFQGRVKAELVNFLMLLLDKGRIKFLPGILDEFNKIADRKRNILNMKIISAAPLEESQINKIKDKYKKLHNAYYVNAETEINKDLVGGIKIQIGDKVIDGSIKGRLESLRELLIKN